MPFQKLRQLQPDGVKQRIPRKLSVKTPMRKNQRKVRPMRRIRRHTNPLHPARFQESPLNELVDAFLERTDTDRVFRQQLRTLRQFAPRSKLS